MKIITLLFALLAFNETIAEMGRVSYQDYPPHTAQEGNR